MSLNKVGLTLTYLDFEKLSKTVRDEKKVILIEATRQPNPKLIKTELSDYRGTVYYSEVEKVRKTLQQLLIEFVNTHRVLPQYNNTIPLDSGLSSGDGSGFVYVVVGRKYVPRNRETKSTEVTTGSKTKTQRAKSLTYRQQQEREEQREWERNNKELLGGQISGFNVKCLL